MDWQEYKNSLQSKYDGKELILIERAFNFASEAHKNQKRLTGEPFICHPAAVSLKTAELKLNPQAIAAALLHDASEENQNLLKAIRKEFGQEIAFLVKGLTKVDKINYRGIERNTESLRRMFMAMAQDIRVVIIKLLDRLDNLETLHVFPEEKRKRIALETLEIYAPVADRLGMGEIKSQLEDLAFKHAYPEEYGWILKETREKIPRREEYLKKIMPILERELIKERIKIKSMHFRAKHYYSLWKKLLRNTMDWYLIYDLAAVRIVVNSVEDCYAVLGVIHKLWKPLPGRIKDYIALPKQNGYQSLHTTVFCINKKVVEFQIRTEEMHEEAEYGIAAHWAWEMAGKPKQTKEMPHRKFAWIQQLKDWNKKFNEEITSEKFLESLKIDFFKNRVFVLTPKGDVVDLPEGATPVDFAYHIHSEIGNTMIAAKVNNRMVPLSYELASGDMVEILTQKNKKPSIKLLDYTKTSIASQHIKSALKKSGLLPGFADKKPLQPKTEMTITVIDRVGLLKDISAVFSSFRINLQSLTTKEAQESYASIYLTFAPKNKEQVKKISTRLKNIGGIEEVDVKTMNLEK